MVSDSNQRLIVAYWRQYFFIEYRNLPPETIGVPPLARAIVPSGTARKAAGELRRLRPVGQTSAGLLVILDFRRPLSRGTGESPVEGLMPSILRSPRPPCLKHSGRPLESGLRKSRITNNPAEVCPSGRNRRRSPAAFLAVSDGTVALARGGTPMDTGSSFYNVSYGIFWSIRRNKGRISQVLPPATIRMSPFGEAG